MMDARAGLGHPMDLRRYAPRRDVPFVLLAAANVIGVTYIVATLLGSRTLGGQSVLGNLGLEALILMSTVVFFLSAVSQPGRWRKPWLLVSAGLVAALLGSIASIIYTTTLGHVPSPSWADVFYLSLYPLIAAGLVLFPKTSVTRDSAMGFALDAVAVLFGFGMVVAYALVIPTLESAKGGHLALVVAAYPLGDALLIFGLVSLVILRRSLPRDGSIALLAAALALQVIVDILFSYKTLNPGSGGETLLSCLAPVVWILVAWAGYMRLRKKSEDGPVREVAIPNLFAHLVAYLAALAGFGVLLLAARGILATPLGVMIIAAVVVTPLLLARQVLALRESGTLHELKGSHETEQRFRSLVTNSTDAIFVTDADTAILYATPSAERVFGYAADDLIGHCLT